MCTNIQSSPAVSSFHLTNSLFLSEDPTKAKLLIKLMSAYEAMRQARLWAENAAKYDSTKLALMQAYICWCAWTWEARSVLEKACSAPGTLDAGFVADLGGPKSIWTEFKKGNSPRMKVIERVRNKVAFHFDDEHAEKVRLQLIRGFDEAFCEVVGETPYQRNTRYSWARVAFAMAFVDEEWSESKFHETIHDVQEFLKGFNEVVGKVIGHMIEKLGLEIRPGQTALS